METKEIGIVLMENSEFVFCEAEGLAHWIADNDTNSSSDFGAINLTEGSEVIDNVLTKESYFFEKFIDEFELELEEDNEEYIKDYTENFFNDIPPKFTITNINKKEFDLLLNNVHAAHLDTDSISQTLIKVNKLNSNILKLFK